MPKGDDLKGNSEKARERGRLKKGVKHKETLLKEAIGVDRANAIHEQIEKNISEFVSHPNEKIRLDATKAFTDYYKPRKREHTGEFTANLKVVFENIKDQ